MEDNFKGLDFGSYCTIEVFNHGAENHFFLHKVIGRSNSNAHVSVPIKYGIGATGHDEVLGGEIVPVLYVICCGVVETKVFKVRVCDVSPADQWIDRAIDEVNASELRVDITSYDLKSILALLVKKGFVPSIKQ